MPNLNDFFPPPTPVEEPTPQSPIKPILRGEWTGEHGEGTTVTLSRAVDVTKTLVIANGIGNTNTTGADVVAVLTSPTQLNIIVGANTEASIGASTVTVAWQLLEFN